MTKRYIGMVELSVHLSSMNPLGHINERNAYTILERSLIKLSYEAFHESNEKSILLADAVIPAGDIHKYYHFRSPQMLLQFSIKLRSALLKSGIPFKISCTEGQVSEGSLQEKWEPVLDEIERTDPSEKRNQDLTKEVQEHFGTVERSKIEEIFKLFRAPAFHGDMVQLSIATQNFKGIGIHLPEIMRTVQKAEPESRIFDNFFPSGVFGKKQELTRYLDVMFDFSDDDVIYRLTADLSPEGHAQEIKRRKDREVSQEVKLGSGSIIQVSQVLRLLRHSVAARADSGAFYISILSNFVRSSSFARLIYKEKSANDEAGEIALASGWQYYPPIFGMLISPENARILRAIGGINTTLGALFDEVIASRLGLPRSYMLVSNVDEEELPDLMLSEFKIFPTLVSRFRTLYGEATIRSSLTLPDPILSPARKRALLRVVSN